MGGISLQPAGSRAERGLQPRDDGAIITHDDETIVTCHVSGE